MRKDHEADEGHAIYIDDEEMRRNFRGETIEGSACQEWQTGEESFIDPRYYNPSKPRYKFADAFYGASGVSSGAKAAGLRVDLGFDYHPAAIDPYR